MRRIVSTLLQGILFASLFLIKPAFAQQGMRNDYQNGGQRFDAEKYKVDRERSQMQQQMQSQQRGQQQQQNRQQNYSTPRSYNRPYIDNKPVIPEVNYEYPKSGFARYEFKDKSIYEGEWSQHIMHGKGTMKFSSGQEFEGVYNQGKKISGTLTFASGDVFTGTFRKDGTKDSGVYIWKTGQKYVGKFYNELRHDDHGIMVDRDGSKFEGRWRNDKKNGNGKLYDKTGKLMQEGEWEENKYLVPLDYTVIPPSASILPIPAFELKAPLAPSRSGAPNEDVATHNFPNGDVYKGGWKRKKMEGYRSEYHFSNGDKYIGSFADNKMSGRGTYFFANGERIETTFDKNEIGKTGTYYFSNGDKSHYNHYGLDKVNNKPLYEYIFANGDSLSGFFSTDMLHSAWATFKYKNGDSFMGNFANGKKNGSGTYTWADGAEWHGDFKDDKMPLEKGRLSPRVRKY